MEDTLFSKKVNNSDMSLRPLAYRMRPSKLEDFIGQGHILDEGKLLNRLIEKDCIQSVILWGPPGCGKNSLALLIASLTKRNFISLNAVESDTQHLRKTVETSRFNLQQFGKKTVVFIDEIHRFNKAQQDLLLPYIEEGDVTLIGATTYNPAYSLIGALRSRSLIFELKPLKKEDIVKIANRAIQKEQEKIDFPILISEEVLRIIAEKCGGDARIALNTVEVIILSIDKNNNTVTRSFVEECLPKTAVRYDKDESEHYDTISIYIKSMRGSDPDSAVYWLGKMIEGGEDPAYIARRLCIFASEDIGMADPKAILIADSALHLVSEIGMPEARIVLSHATIYLATAPKSNSSIIAIDNAINDIKTEGAEDAPDFVRKTGVKKENYVYSHDSPEGITGQDYRGSSKIYYIPGNKGYESLIQKRTDLWKQIKQKRKLETK
jgi:putative ATPase